MRIQTPPFLPLLWILALGCSDNIASAGGESSEEDVIVATDSNEDPSDSTDALFGEKDLGESPDTADTPPPSDTASNEDVASVDTSTPDATLPEPDTGSPTDVVQSSDSQSNDTEGQESGDETGSSDVTEPATDAATDAEDAVTEDTLCVPDCEDKTCGDDGCGATCGACDDTETCTPDGTCACVPNCEDKKCGLDGCGGLCGFCPPGIPCGPTGLCIGSSPSESCDELMNCMVEVGCGCNGINCPTNIAARLECVDTCQASNACTSFCFGAGTDVDASLLALDTCVELHCPQITAECLLEFCGPESNVCLEDGILGCTDILNCVDDCEEDDCAASCTLQASPTAILQYEAHTNCVETLCTGESEFCESWADAVVCTQLVPACAIVTGTGLCDVAESCTLACGMNPTTDCLETCMTGLDASAAASFADAATCAMTTCSDLPGGITGECFFNALTGPECDGLLTDCAPCEIDLLTDFSPAFVVSSMAVGSGGNPGESVNVDPENGPDDCSPANACSEGLDNQLALLNSFGINEELASSIDSGALAILGEMAGAPGEITAIHIYSGGAADASCPLKQGSCGALLAKEAFASDCSPLASVGDVSVSENGLFTAGGDDAVIPLPLAFEAGVTLVIPLRRARLTGTLTVDTAGVTLVDTVFGGALRKEELAETISVLPGDTFAGLPKEVALALLDTLDGDIDTDNDGIDDALSIGLAVSAVPTTIVGVE